MSPTKYTHIKIIWHALLFIFLMLFRISPIQTSTWQQNHARRLCWWCLWQQERLPDCLLRWIAYSTCRGGYLRGLLTGLFKLIATFYMFDLDYPPVHSMFMEIMQTFVTEEQVYSGIEYLPVSGERTGTKMSKFSGCIPFAIFFLIWWLILVLTLLVVVYLVV